MARVNITVPDTLMAQVRGAGLNVSRVATSALTEELDRLAKIAELDAYLADLEARDGPIPEAEKADTGRWADRLLADGEADTG